jgi:hypothetical protein
MMRCQNSIADQLAANGYLVVMPDILDNDPIPLPENRPEGFSLQAWLEKPSHQPEFVQPIVDKVLAEMKKQFSMCQSDKEVGISTNMGDDIQILRRSEPLDTALALNTSSDYWMAALMLVLSSVPIKPVN